MITKLEVSILGGILCGISYFIGILVEKHSNTKNPTKTVKGKSH